MKSSYIIDYINDNEFKKKQLTLKFQRKPVSWLTNADMPSEVLGTRGSLTKGTSTALPDQHILPRIFLWEGTPFPLSLPRLHRINPTLSTMSGHMT